MSVAAVEGVEVRGPLEARFEEILTPEALRFVADLHCSFGAERTETKEIRVGDWTIAPIPTSGIAASRSPAVPTGRCRE